MKSKTNVPKKIYISLDNGLPCCACESLENAMKVCSGPYAGPYVLQPPKKAAKKDAKKKSVKR